MDNEGMAGLGESRFIVDLAASDREIRESQALRHRVFVEEMGARPVASDVGLEADRFDDYCHHLMVRDRQTSQVVASTRLLTDTQARLCGGFYSEGEFDLGPVHHLSGRIMEIGRSCVHPDYRQGGAIGTLWAGLARFMDINRFGYLIGCASIPASDGGRQAEAIMRQLRSRHLSAEDARVRPHRPLPPCHEPLEAPRLPPLLKAYLRLGARVCGEPCLDPVFNTADVFVLLDREQLHRRYHRHFVERPLRFPRAGRRAVALDRAG